VTDVNFSEIQDFKKIRRLQFIGYFFTKVAFFFILQKKNKKIESPYLLKIGFYKSLKKSLKPLPCLHL
jgi:hypothetical protein